MIRKSDSSVERSRVLIILLSLRTFDNFVHSTLPYDYLLLPHCLCRLHIKQYRYHTPALCIGDKIKQRIFKDKYYLDWTRIHLPKQYFIFDSWFQLPCTYEWYEYIERRLLAVVVSFCSIIVITSVWKLSFLRINIVNGTDKIASFVQRLRHLVKTRATGLCGHWNCFFLGDVTTKCNYYFIMLL